MNSLKPLLFASSLFVLLLPLGNSRTAAQDTAKSTDPPVTTEKSETQSEDKATVEKPEQSEDKQDDATVEKSLQSEDKPAAEKSESSEDKPQDKVLAEPAMKPGDAKKPVTPALAQDDVTPGKIDHFSKFRSSGSRTTTLPWGPTIPNDHSTMPAPIAPTCRTVSPGLTKKRRFGCELNRIIPFRTPCFAWLSGIIFHNESKVFLTTFKSAFLYLRLVVR